MTSRTLRTPLPPTFSKFPPKNVEARNVGQRDFHPVKSVEELRDIEVGKSGETHRIIDWSPGTWIWVLIVPVVVWCLLLILMPTFVKTKGGDTRADYQSMLVWTLIISLVIWILFFGFAKCKSC